MSGNQIEQTYQLARERYAALGVDTEAALTALAGVALSVHCWQGNDVGGFERPDAALSGGGIQVTGNYPGKARNVGELRARPGEGVFPPPRPPSVQSARQLWRVRREGGGQGRGRAGSLPGLGVMGEGAGPEARLQLDPLLSPQSG